MSLLETFFAAPALPRFVPHVVEAVSPVRELERVAHDARNVVSALMLYGELLEEPGVLEAEYRHYAVELQGLTQTMAGLLERMALPRERSLRYQPSLRASEATKVESLLEELLRMHPMLAAMAGPRITVAVAAQPCSGWVFLAGEDLARILINLVRNAADAMPKGGRIRITAQCGEGLSFLDSEERDRPEPRSLVFAVQDSGPGVAPELRERIFEPGFTMRSADGWSRAKRRGLGLSIVRDLAEASGGSVRALGGVGTRGARLELTLPVTSDWGADAKNVYGADCAREGCLECL